MASQNPLLWTTTLLCAVPLLLHAEERQDAAFWQFQTSAYTKHFTHDPEHNNHQKLLGIEYDDASGWIVGGAAFRNSFDQASQYVYVGKRYDSQSTPFYLKVSGGLLHGYKGEYDDKIPFNRFGVAPAIIPTLGVHAGPLTAELNILGTAAIMVNVGVRWY